MKSWRVMFNPFTGAVAVTLSMLGCDRSPPVDPSPETTAVPVVVPATRSAPRATLRVNGASVDLPAPVISIDARPPIVRIQISSPATETTQPVMERTQPATETTQTKTGEVALVGYFFEMDVPAASIDDVPAVVWTRVLSEFPEDSAEGFFLDDGATQLVPASVRADFKLVDGDIHIHLTGECYRRSETPGSAAQRVTVDAVFVGPTEVEVQP